MAGPGAQRFYSSTAIQTNLNVGISAGATSLVVQSASGYPNSSSVPFTICIDQNTGSEELILVGAVSGTTFSSLTRGVDGTSAVSHANQAPVTHVMYAQDLRDPQNHIGAYDQVHGLSSGSLVVGTTDSQTLTNKVLTTPQINQINNSGGGSLITNTTGAITVPSAVDTLVGRATTDTLTNKTLTSPTITGTGTIAAATETLSGLATAQMFTATGLTGATTTTRYVGGTSGGPPVTGTFNTGDVVFDIFGSVWICLAAGSPGTWTTGQTGIVATPNTTTNTSNNSGGSTETFDTVLGYYTANLISGKRYRVNLDGCVHNVSNTIAVGETYLLQIRDSQSNSNPTAASLCIAQTQWSPQQIGTAGRTPFNMRQTFVASNTGPHTFGFSFWRQAGGTTVYNSVASSSGTRELYVEAV